MVKKRPKQSNSASSVAKNNQYLSTPEEFWKKNGSQFKYPNDSVGLVCDLSNENVHGFHSFCKVC